MRKVILVLAAIVLGFVVGCKPSRLERLQLLEAEKTRLAELEYHLRGNLRWASRVTETDESKLQVSVPLDEKEGYEGTTTSDGAEKTILLPGVQTIADLRKQVNDQRDRIMRARMALEGL